MTDKNTGGPAFPVPGFEYLDDRGEEDERIVYQPFGGMSIRDYFAAKAMQGYCSREGSIECDADDIARDAYMIADAMLEARND